ncbi:MAG: DUF4333 domain-containing protein [Thermoleophilaceae bacterium]
MRRPAFTAAIAVLAMAGCGTTEIDAGKAEKLLRSTTTSQGRIVSAKCPSGVEAKAGVDYECRVRLANGDSGTWTLHVRDSEGRVTGSEDDLDVGPPAKPASDRDVGKSFEQAAPGGGRVRVTLVRYEHSVAMPSGSAILKNVVGIVLRIENVGDTTVRSKRPTYYAVLHEPSGAGTDPVSKGSPACGGNGFYRKPLVLEPGQRDEGCIPYAVGPLPVDFEFGFGDQNARWRLVGP